MNNVMISNIRGSERQVKLDEKIYRGCLKFFIIVLVLNTVFAVSEVFNVRGINEYNGSILASHEIAPSEYQINDSISDNRNEYSISLHPFELPFTQMDVRVPSEQRKFFMQGIPTRLYGRVIHNNHTGEYCFIVDKFGKLSNIFRISIGIIAAWLLGTEIFKMQRRYNASNG